MKHKVKFLPVEGPKGIQLINSIEFLAWLDGVITAVKVHLGSQAELFCDIQDGHLIVADITGVPTTEVEGAHELTFQPG